MKLEILIAYVMLTSSCKADSGPIRNENWLVPECSKSDANPIHVNAPSIKFGVVDGNKVCVSGEKERIYIESSVRFFPKKSDLNQIKFECDREQAELISRKHPNERLYLFVKGQPSGAMRIPESTDDDVCTISAPTNFSDALILCETLAAGMGLDRDGCTRPCVGDEKVCVVVKARP